MATTIEYTNDLTKVAEAEQLVVLGTRATLARPEVLHALGTGETAAALGAVWGAMVDSLAPGDLFAATATWIARPESPLRVTAIAISDRVSRHNAPGRPDAVSQALKGRFGKGRAALVVALERPEELFAIGAAIARAFPRYSRKKKAEAESTLAVVFVAAGGARPHDRELARLGALGHAIREAARLTDTPPSELSTDDLVAEARALATELGLECVVLSGDALRERGMGGLVNVGKAARHGPALVHLRYAGTEPAVEAVALVGKGIVYDTGGLSLKGKGDMPGMKVDMGGAAAVLQAMRLAVGLGAKARIDGILCLAENSVGPDAMRPDDVITLYSGKTIEVNNTDAEGRLVLADGVAFAVKDLGAGTVVDLATLTGAQLVATGKLHAAVISNDEALERAAVLAGRRSGDLVFPLPFAPELFRPELQSPVADLRNSVKDRMNAQSSCAAQFIAESLPAEGVRWLHIDMAGPVTARDRATGYGVALLAELFMRDEA